MDSILEKIGDKRLSSIAGSLTEDLPDEEVSTRFKQITEEFPDYDPTFLWILSYPERSWSVVNNYIDANYKKFHKYLDSGFSNKISKKFDHHLWEMIVCDMFASVGRLVPKNAAGADFIVDTPSGQIQIEAIVPEEAIDPVLRSIKPDYSVSKISTREGKIEDLERPVLLRFLQAFDDKSETATYDRTKPLIIAINTHKAVGFTSRDNYVIRQVLFGLGCETITKEADDTYRHGLQYKPTLNKPDKPEFPVARFRDNAYSHISGVIYTSQSPAGLVPGNWGWSNYGITYVPNPNAVHKIDLELPFSRKLICSEDLYEEIDATQPFVSSIQP